MQILIITHYLKLEAFFFFNISKAFDKVLQKGLSSKVESLGISGNLVHLFRSFFNDRYERVVLNGQVSYWATVLSGILQY